MGQCFAISLQIPTIPAVVFPSIVFQSPFPIGVDLPCCKFKIRLPIVDEAIDLLNLAISSAIELLSAGATAAIMTANMIIAKVQAKVNKLRIRIPTCPVDGADISI